MILDRILANLAPGTLIPKPSATCAFAFKGQGTVRGERAIVYSIPSRKHAARPGQKAVTESQLDKAYAQLVRLAD